MSFNEEELKKIKRATSGSSKKSARHKIAQAISELRPKIENAKKLPKQERQSELKKLVNEVTAARHRALQSGANSYSDPDWAAAAACESWLHELAGGNTESIARVEVLISKLEGRKINSFDKKISHPKLSRKEKIDKFIEGAKLTGFTPLVTGPEYVNNLANEYGQDKWNYYATVAALGSIIVKKWIEFEEENKQELIKSYRSAIQEWNKPALNLIDELTDLTISKDITSKEEFHYFIGAWIIEKVKGSKLEPENSDAARTVGKLIRDNMEIFMFH